MKREIPKPPKHLKAATQKWFAGVVETYELESHHVLLLAKAAEAWDRAEEARELLKKHGITYVDRFEQPRARPEVAIERNAMIAFVRLLRELALDVEPPQETRLPRRAGTGR